MESLTFVKPQAEFLARLRRVPPFSAFRPEDLPELLAGARQAAAPPGSMLPMGDEPGRVLHVILEGTVCLMRSLSHRGHRCLIEICDAPCLVGEAALFDDQAAAVEAEVLRQVLFIELQAGAVRRCLKNSPTAQLRMLGYMSARLKRLVSQITTLKLMTGPQRLAQFLTALADHTGRSDGVDLPFEKRTLAALLGMTPESLSRAFRRLQPLGVGSGHGGTVTIADVERLRQFIEAETPH